jgi:DNA ligase-1
VNDSDLQHGCDWDRIKDLTGWLLTEKLDGCRAFWDGTRFWTRGSNVIDAPIAMSAGLTVPTDGEIWAGRGGFKRASVAVRHGVKWAGVEFVPFNSLPVTVCESNAHALDLMRQIQAAGGEGLVARKPGLVWRPGRTVDMLKIK